MRRACKRVGPESQTPAGEALFYFASPANEEAYMASRQHLTIDELKVLTLKEWAALNTLSFPTAKRLIAAGLGPKIVRLSARRVGIRVIDNARWQESRMRGA
jgi:predicted DNA-binding transcriptional regulator AlpA